MSMGNPSQSDLLFLTYHHITILPLNNPWANISPFKANVPCSPNYFRGASRLKGPAIVWVNYSSCHHLVELFLEVCSKDHLTKPPRSTVSLSILLCQIFCCYLCIKKSPSLLGVMIYLIKSSETNQLWLSHYSPRLSDTYWVLYWVYNILKYWVYPILTLCIVNFPIQYNS